MAGSSVCLIISVANLVGFGAVVASLPAFEAVKALVLGIEGGPLVSLAAATNSPPDTELYQASMGIYLFNREILVRCLDNNLVDFGRELDGAEDVHCIEGLHSTEIAAEDVDFRPGDYFVPKRRYSAFYGTDFEILLKGLDVQTLILTGGLTDVCVHYTFVDGHQGNYYCRVVEDCVGGSSEDAHNASLRAMEYLQTGARCKSTDILEAFAARTRG